MEPGPERTMSGTVGAGPPPHTHIHILSHVHKCAHTHMHAHRHWVSLLCQSFFLSGHTVLGTGGGGPKTSKEQSRVRMWVGTIPDSVILPTSGRDGRAQRQGEVSLTHRASIGSFGCHLEVALLVKEELT